MSKIHCNDQLNVDVKLPLTVEFDKIDGVIKYVQIFPNDEELEHMYIVYVEPNKLESVKTFLEEHEGIKSVELVAKRFALRSG